MIDRSAVWNNGLEVLRGLTPFYQQEAVARIEEAHARDAWLALLLGAGLEPGPLTKADIASLVPYAAPERPGEQIGSALEGGFLVEETPGQYRLTNEGRAVVNAFFDYAQGAIAEIPALDTADMITIANLLERVVKATESLPEPESKIGLTTSRWTDPGMDGPLMVQIDQYITDLASFRDDAHIAAWKPYGVDGRSWETLTFIWREEAHTAEELAEALPRRGYDATAYEDALRILENRGWIERVEDKWLVTDKGRSVREEAEVVTDRIFYAGWDILNESQLEELSDLLERLLAQLKEVAPVAEAS